MSGSGTALVLVQPGDTIEAVLRRAQQSGARHVSLLVPADNAHLQVRKNVNALRAMLAQSGVDLVIISSDERVIGAARASGVEAIAIDGATVAGPLIPQRRSPPSGPPAEDAEAAELLALLDRADVTDRPPARAAQPAEASLDDLSALLDQQRPSSAGRETVPVAAIRREPAPAPRAEPPRRAAPTRDAMRPARRIARPQPAPYEDEAEEPAEEQPAPPRRRAVRRPASFSGIATLVVLTLLIALAALWALSSRATVTVYAPASRVREIPLVDEVIPVNSNAGNGAPAIHAIPADASPEFSVSGTVESQSVSPTGRARGVVTVINTIDQALSLPDGTEFVGRNAQGAEVRFVVDAPLTVPGSTTSVSLSGRSTVYGQAQVNVTARSPGAASNVADNTVRQILIPGQPLIDCGTSNFICQNGPISGGSDEPQWVVTTSDVQRVLGDALTGLYNAGMQQLSAKTRATDQVDPTTVSPSPEDLARPDSYEPPLLEPPLGQAADPGTREFRLTVRARFTALVVRQGNLVQDQLREVVPAHLAQRGEPLCAASEVSTPKIDRWRWDGVSLKISGVITCAPGSALPPETRLLVREALRGKSIADADAALRDLQQQGLIGDYQLPEGAGQLPGLDLLLNVQFMDTSAP